MGGFRVAGDTLVEVGCRGHVRVITLPDVVARSETGSGMLCWSPSVVPWLDCESDGPLGANPGALRDRRRLTWFGVHRLSK